MPPFVGTGYDPPVSTILEGKYRLLKSAGSGGTANVYLAERTADQTRVAVKVLKKSLAGQRDMLGRFEREAKLLTRIDDPHVVKLIELADAPEGLLLIMEWAEGTRLDTLELSPAEVRVVLTQLASALAAIHGAGIVHRDFKPENVIVRKDENGLHSWLLDLGIARFRDAAEAATQFMTAAGQGAGTPSFLSPEQVRGEQPDPHSDVYSFGVVAWKLITGALPFVGGNDFEVLQMHLKQKPPKFVARDASLADLERLIVQCLEKKREDRPADGAALVGALGAPAPVKQKKAWWKF